MTSQFKVRVSVADRLFAIAITAVAALPMVSWAQNASAQTVPAGPKVKVLAITQALPNLPQYTKVDQVLLRDGLAAKSNGRIEVQLFSWPERNVNGPEVLRLVRSGQADIGFAPLGMVSGDVPMLDAMDLAGLAPDYKKARQIVDALMPAANKDLEALGIRMIGTQAYAGQMMFCRKPVPSLTDLQGLSVRTAGPSLGDLIKSLNGQPVSLNFGEVYTALERGTVDCAVTGSSGGNAAKWTEVTTHIVSYPLQWAVSGYYVNLGWWNKLDPQVRALMEKTFQEITDAQWALGLDLTSDGLACNIGQADGCKTHTLVKKPLAEVKSDAGTPAAIQKRLTEVVLPNWVRRCGDRCAQVYNDVVAPISGVKLAGK